MQIYIVGYRTVQPFILFLYLQFSDIIVGGQSCGWNVRTRDPGLLSGFFKKSIGFSSLFRFYAVGCGESVDGFVLIPMSLRNLSCSTVPSAERGCVRCPSVLPSSLSVVHVIDCVPVDFPGEVDGDETEYQPAE